MRRELDECGVRVPGRAGLGGARAWRSSRRALRWERLPFPQRPAAAFRAAADSLGKGVLHGRGAEPGGPGSHRGPAAAGVPAVGCSSRFTANSERSELLCARCLSLGPSVPVRCSEAARPAVLPTGLLLCPVRSPCRVSGVQVRQSSPAGVHTYLVQGLGSCWFPCCLFSKVLPSAEHSVPRCLL